MPREEPGRSLLKRHLSALWVKVPSSHGVGISTLWPDTWPQTINIKTHGQAGTADRPLSLTPWLYLQYLCLRLCSPSSTSPSSFFFLPFIQPLTWKGPLIIDLGPHILHILHMDNLQNKMRTKEGFILALLIHENHIHQHAKFRNRAHCFTCFISALFWATAVTSCQQLRHNFHPCTHKQEEYTQ